MRYPLIMKKLTQYTPEEIAGLFKKFGRVPAADHAGNSTRYADPNECCVLGLFYYIDKGRMWRGKAMYPLSDGIDDRKEATAYADGFDDGFSGRGTTLFGDESKAVAYNKGYEVGLFLRKTRAGSPPSHAGS